ncbi:MAG: hypothetical protein QXT20_04435 [Candidatus Woesearchaeota archaeon]
MCPEGEGGNLEEVVEKEFKQVSVSSLLERKNCLEGLLEDYEPKLPSVKERLAKILKWPLENYSIVMGALLPASALFLASSAWGAAPLSYYAAAPLATFALAFLHQRTEHYEEHPSKPAMVFRLLSRNYAAVGFGLAALSIAACYFRMPAVLDMRTLGGSYSALKSLLKVDPEAEVFFQAGKSLVEARNVVFSFVKYLAAESFFRGALYSAGVKVFTLLRPEDANYWKMTLKQAVRSLKLGVGSIFLDSERIRSFREASLEGVLEKIRAGYASRVSLWEAADLQMQLGRFDEALSTYARILENRQTLLFRGSGFNPVRKVAAAIKYNNSSRGKSIEECISNAFGNFVYDGELAYSIREFERAIQLAQSSGRTRDSKNLKLLYAIFVRETTGEEKALRLAEHWLSSFYSDGGFSSMRRIPSSRNEVFEVLENSFLRDSIIIKRRKGDEPFEDVKNAIIEHYLSNFLSATFSEIPSEFSRIVPSSLLIFYDWEDRLCQVMVRSIGRNLEEKLRDSTKAEKEECLKRVLRSSVLIHFVGEANLMKDEKSHFLTFYEGRNFRINIKKFDYLGMLKKRFIGRIGENANLEGFIREMADYANSIGDINALCHGDAYLTNFLEDGSWIDLEKGTIANPMLDIAALMEVPELEGIDRKEMLEYYLTRFREENPDRTAELDKLRKSYTPLRVFNSLYNSGRAYSHNNLERSAYFLKNAASALEEEGLYKILNKLYDYLTSSEKEPFRSTLKRL